MHISEGVLSPVVLGVGAILSIVGTAIGLSKLDYERLVLVALLASAFFVASLVHIPIGPSSVHLLLNGLLGLFLGWAAFPAMLIALLLQAILFSYGGLTVLGVNTFNQAFPAVLCGLLFRHRLSSSSKLFCRVAAFLCGALSVVGAGILTALSLAFSHEGFIETAKIFLLAHIPVMLVEGIMTVFVVSFVAKIRPELLSLARGNTCNG